MTKHPGLFAALAAPFAARELKTRPQGGRQLQYVTARTVMNRLDAVLGPENWFDDYSDFSGSSCVCRLTVRLPDDQLLTKCDAGGAAGMADAGDDDKSIVSDAFKRAAVKFGVGRYLYGDGAPRYAPPEAARDRRALPPPAANGKPKIEWDRDPKPAAATAVSTVCNGHGPDPKSGRELFAWVRKQEQRLGVVLVPWLNGWAKLQEFPPRMVDFDAAQVKLALAEARRKLGSLQGEVYEGPTP